MNRNFLTMVLTFCLLIPGSVCASGAFSPGGGARSEAYNQGKAIVTARSENGCKACHQSYKRKTLRDLSTKIPDLLMNCNVHSPCYSEEFTDTQLDALDTYFNQRYRL